MYEEAEAAKVIGTFTSLANFDQVTSNSFTLSRQNFATRADGKYLIPIVFSWIAQTSSIIAADIVNLLPDLNTVETPIYGGNAVNISWSSRADSLGDSNRAAVFIHTPKAAVDNIYRLGVSFSSGELLTLTFR